MTLNVCDWRVSIRLSPKFNGRLLLIKRYYHKITRYISLKMNTRHVVETSIIVNTSPIQHYTPPDDHISLLGSTQLLGYYSR